MPVIHPPRLQTGRQTRRHTQVSRMPHGATSTSQAAIIGAIVSNETGSPARPTSASKRITLAPTPAGSHNSASGQNPRRAINPRFSISHPTRIPAPFQVRSGVRPAGVRGQPGAGESRAQREARFEPSHGGP